MIFLIKSSSIPFLFLRQLKIMPRDDNKDRDDDNDLALATMIMINNSV